MKYSPFLPEDQWKQESVDESVKRIVAELQRKKHDELMKAITTLNELFNPPK